ncbi:MAG: LPXTG cell wall anchor domain-containing protein [Actinomycetota bacterium]|nr:LPXTG cell wall anchor domain-containing protein [Actinomycetota bacterium]
MKAGLRGAVALAGATCLVGTYLAVPMAANAAGTAPVPFSNAVFNGYGTGDELHTGALNTGTVQLADLEQAFSSASTNTAGLTPKLTDTDTGQIIQPSQAATTKAYGMGDGLEVGVATNPGGPADPNQLLLAGKAESIAPPNRPEVVKTINPGAVPGLGSVGLLNGRALSLFDTNTCPLGQPISFGLGDAANVQLITGTTAALPLPIPLPMIPGLPALGLPSGTAPVINTAGSGTSTAHSDSETFVNSNGDGTFGLATQARETIAPVTITLGPLAIEITVSGQDVNNPVTLQAITTGNPTGAKVQLLNNAIIGVNLVTTAVPGGPSVTAPLIPATSLQSITGPTGLVVPIPGVGTITIGAPLTMSTVGGTHAQGDFNIASIALGGAGTALPSLLNFELGHLQAVANTAAPFTCPLPIVKTANPPSVTAGNSFVYTILVPDPAKLDLLACSLANINVVDTISDAPNGGKPTFRVVSANMGGKINQTSTTNATVTFTNLSYTVAPVGQKANPPLALTITVTVPKDSPTGTLQDIANATATANGCNGGASGITNLGGVNGTALNGSTRLLAPKVTLAAVTPAGAASQPAAGSGTPGALPRTGGQGGLWQPGLGVGLLALAGGAFALLRRSRRGLSGS